MYKLEEMGRQSGMLISRHDMADALLNLMQQ